MIRRTMSTAFVAVVLALAFVPVSAAAPAPAPAASESVARNWVSDFTQPGVRIRTRPSVNATVVGHGNPRDMATIHRLVHGDAVTCPDGRRTTEWYELTNMRTHVSGFSSTCYVP
ncbi:hypothetical protein [Umezawaea beigongshangensis]|uniref:hypothetical protein n=1 Tax=Umezawaea beigongshangensis TaxID=2780383 RepID=UPI0018F15D87|nr:hypothetical protein [Umezawaea beigongshangensis]